MDDSRKIILKIIYKCLSDREYNKCRARYLNNIHKKLREIQKRFDYKISMLTSEEMKNKQILRKMLVSLAEECAKARNKCLGDTKHPKAFQDQVDDYVESMDSDYLK